MTHLAKFALLGTVALLAAVGCQREPVDVNPNYDPETKEVVTDFVFNVAAAESPKTKMTDAVVQATTSNTFRGIERAVLYAFSQKTATNTLDDGKHLWTNAGLAEKTFDLGTVMASGSINPQGTVGGVPPQSRRVLELSMPSETNTFLFYGAAIRDVDNNVKVGKVNMHVSNQPVKTHIDIQPIIEGSIGTFNYDGDGGAVGAESGSLAEKFRETATLFSCLMTHIVNAGWSTDATKRRALNESAAPTVSFGGSTYPGDFSGKTTLHWSDYGAAIKGLKNSPINPDKDLIGLEENLANAFNTLTTLNVVNNITEFRAGSADALLFQLKDLYDIIKSVSNATPTSIEEAVAQTMANAILSIMGNYYDAVDKAWQPLTTIISGITNSCAVPSLVAVNNAFEHVPGTYTQFPANFNMPVGSTCVTVSEKAGSIVYEYNLDSIDNSDLGGGSGSTTNIYSYSYPPELCYFSNSPLVALSKEKSLSEYPDGAAQWNSWASDGWWATYWSGYTNHVSSDSKAVAMKNMVNYGTSLLKTTVKYSGAGTFYDNYKALHGNLASEADNQFVLSGASPDNGTYSLNLALTGVLIGGQPNQVGWNYLPVKEGTSAGEYVQATAGDFYQMVYDPLPTPMPVSLTKSSPIYTLTFDNYVSGDEQQKVYVALEFVNNGDSFWGMHNMVRTGGKFYIIGILDPEDITASGPAWKLDNYALPPYNPSTGVTIQTPRVFIQDYTTTANFTLGQYSLKSAYVTVPDLRSSQLSFGMSVDMEWETGMSFDVELGK